MTSFTGMTTLLMSVDFQQILTLSAPEDYSQCLNIIKKEKRFSKNPAADAAKAPALVHVTATDIVSNSFT